MPQIVDSESGGLGLPKYESGFGVGRVAKNEFSQKRMVLVAVAIYCRNRLNLPTNNGIYWL